MKNFKMFVVAALLGLAGTVQARETEIVYYSRRTMAATANVDDAIYSGGTGIKPIPIVVVDWWEGAAITTYLRLATPAGADSSRNIRVFVKGLSY